MAFDPLTPAPRLPEDLTVVSGHVAPGGLGAMLTENPAGDVVHVSLLETRTPLCWESGFSRQVYNWQLGKIQESIAKARAVAEDVLQRFAQEPSLPPQAPGGTPR